MRRERAEPEFADPLLEISMTMIEGAPVLTPEHQEQLVQYKPELVALYKDVEAARIKLLGSNADGLSDFEFMQLVELAYPGDGRVYSDLSQRIEASHAAINRALIGGEWEFVSRLASLQKGQTRSSAGSLRS